MTDKKRTVKYALNWGGETHEIELPEDEIPDDPAALYDRICSEAGVADEPVATNEFIRNLSLLS